MFMLFILIEIKFKIDITMTNYEKSYGNIRRKKMIIIGSV